MGSFFLRSWVYLLQDCAEFLALLAIQMGKLKKGATPDREMAARIGRNKTKFNSIDNLFMDSTLDPIAWTANLSLMAGKVLRQLKVGIGIW